MPTRNVNLTEHFDRFIDEGVKSGRFSDASEMVREGLRLLQQRQQEHHERIAWLRSEVREGLDAVERGDVMRFDTADERRDFLKQRTDEVLRESAAKKRSA